MITVKYESGGVAISDFKIDKWVADVCEYANCLRSHNKGNGYPFAISNYPPILALQLAVVEGRLSPTNVRLIILGERVQINENGVISNMPESFRAIELQLTRERAMAVLKRAQEKHEEEKRKE